MNQVASRRDSPSAAPTARVTCDSSSFSPHRLVNAPALRTKRMRGVAWWKPHLDDVAEQVAVQTRAGGEHDVVAPPVLELAGGAGLSAAGVEVGLGDELEVVRGDGQRAARLLVADRDRAPAFAGGIDRVADGHVGAEAALELGHKQPRGRGGPAIGEAQVRPGLAHLFLDGRAGGASQALGQIGARLRARLEKRALIGRERAGARERSVAQIVRELAGARFQIAQQVDDRRRKDAGDQRHVAEAGEPQPEVAAGRQIADLEQLVRPRIDRAQQPRQLWKVEPLMVPMSLPSAARKLARADRSTARGRKTPWKTGVQVPQRHARFSGTRPGRPR